MKKLFYAFSALALLFASCSSDSDSSSDSSSAVLVTRIVSTAPGDLSATGIVTYNGNKIVKITEDDGSFEQYTYTGDLITKIEYVLEDGTVDRTEIFTYNAQNKLSAYTWTEEEIDWGGKEVYTHNGDGTISYSYYIGDAEFQTDLNNTGKIYFVNGEVSKMERFSPTTGDLESTRIYTYDNKNNPLKNIVGMDKISYVDGMTSGILHNVISESFSEDVSGGYTSQYTYNANNYPTAQTFYNQDGDLTETIEFFYD